MKDLLIVLIVSFFMGLMIGSAGAWVGIQKLSVSDHPTFCQAISAGYIGAVVRIVPDAVLPTQEEWDSMIADCEKDNGGQSLKEQIITQYG